MSLIHLDVLGHLGVFEGGDDEIREHTTGARPGSVAAFAISMTFVFSIAAVIASAAHMSTLLFFCGLADHRARHEAPPVE